MLDGSAVPTPPQPPPPHLAYLIPAEKFVWRIGDEWTLNQPVGKGGIRAHLLNAGLTQDQIHALLEAEAYPCVYGEGIKPNAPAIFEDTPGRWLINTWRRPSLAPPQQPAPYPVLESILDHATRNDAAGKTWIKSWLAAKIQNPDYLPKIAVVLAAQPASGKGTLFRAIRTMLGFENTAVVTRAELENRFNARWINKLFVLSDEALANDNVKDLSSRLKVWIDGSEVELEGKYAPQTAVRNRLAWLFATNESVSPIIIEQGDRRYSVFVNHDPLAPGYKERIDALFEADRETPTAAFMSEVAGFYYDLLHLEVDRTLIAVPYSNVSRADLIESNLPPHARFFKHVEEHGIDDCLDELLMERDHLGLIDSRPKWDFGAEGVGAREVYLCYKRFCRLYGGHPIGYNKFAAAVANHSPPWPRLVKYFNTPKKAKVLVYQVRR